MGATPEDESLSPCDAGANIPTTPLNVTPLHGPLVYPNDPGRPRIYADNAERQRAYRERLRRDF